ncbi:MAG TPA: serine O-acetyltransferase [Alphaproteobacteria bacterium]|nr:serine O-acetyltransferase [Alphaproteobacteria bacterium]
MSFTSLIHAYRQNDPAAKSVLEVVLLYPGLKAVALHRLANPLFKAGVPFLPRLISEFSRLITGIEIHPGATIGKNLVSDHGMGVVIGETAEVGDDCLIFHGSTLGGKGGGGGKRHPTIGHRVLVGAGAKLLGSINVGNDAKIGANAVVLHDVPAGATAVGVPAEMKIK